MPGSVELIENEKIMYYRFSDPIAVEEIREVMNQGIAMRDVRNHTIHILCDITGVVRVPYGLMSIEQGNELRHPTTGYMAVITRSRLIRSVVDILNGLIGFRKFRFFANEEDARAYLHEKIAEETPSA